MSNSKIDDWIRILERLRFDVTQRDPLQAHKEYDTRSALHVTLDHDGHIRMTLTQQVGDTVSARPVSPRGRAFRVFAEQHSTTHVSYALRAEDDLAAVLDEMESAVSGAPPLTRR